METKNNEENGVLRERFALAMERIGEIAGEATVPEAYQPYFRRTAGFILTMEGLYGEIKNGHTEKYTLEEWQTLNSDRRDDPRNKRNTGSLPYRTRQDPCACCDGD